MSQTYTQFINNPKKNGKDYATFSDNMSTLVACERLRGDLDQLTKAELKEMLITHIAAGATFAVKNEALASENARLRKSNMGKSQELEALREMFGYD
jgi:hypothetical protein